MSEVNSPKLRWGAVWLLYLREMRDQFRDRRTIFTIIVLPIVLYPLLGSLLMQVAQFSSPQQLTVAVIGHEHLPQDIPLFDERRELSSQYAERGHPTTKWYFQSTLDGTDPETRWAEAQDWVLAGGVDAVAYVDEGESPADNRIRIRLLHNASSSGSRTAAAALSQVLGQFNDDLAVQRLQARGIETTLLNPLEIQGFDLAPAGSSGQSFWSKILPFVMLVWALTGAFYPAVDLVAGEKERGTLETLLCSPVLRSEIVIGKMFAVSSFSILTAVLNVVSMLITGLFVSKSFLSGNADVADFSLPPFIPLLWLWIALIPLAVLFSALALAVASLARSSKEGQYYLMPLMMLALPLVILPMMPSIELNAGTSLIPVTGMFLLAHNLIEGNYVETLLHLPFVAAVTGGCLWLAARWAAWQFENEAVLFRGGEHWSLRGWIQHLKRDREGETTAALAYTCGAVILISLFFARLFAQDAPQNFASLAQAAFVPQFAMILAPALIMACGFTKSMRRSLAIRWPGIHVMLAALVIGVCLHPTYMALGFLIRQFFPISPEIENALGPFEAIVNGAPWLSVIFVLALVPALCEELAFRGFIFTGLRRNDGGIQAILVTAILFGLSHGVLQQSIAAACMGGLLGWITLKTGSILPTIVIHFLNNALSVSMGRFASLENPLLQSVIQVGEYGPQYQWGWILMAAGIGTAAVYFLALGKDFESEVVGESEAEMESREPELCGLPSLVSPGTSNV